jgi:hypothetical protein
LELQQIQVNPGEATLIAKDQAIVIANKYFGRNPDAGCYVEERGEYFFISPPYVFNRDIENAGIYVDKRTGEVSKEERRR